MPDASSSTSGGISPTTAAQIRRLLDLPDGVGDDEVRRAVVSRVRLATAALNLGFSVLFEQAMRAGRADRDHRDFWREQFENDPEQTREFLAQTWSQA